MAPPTALRDAAAPVGGAAGIESRPTTRDPEPADTGQPFVFNAADGQALAAHWHASRVGPPRGVAVLAPAAGVPQSFYARFAQWLSGQGIGVLRFDFRGIGASRPARLRGFEADLSHWAHDLDAALACALERGGALPVSLIGHSIGGFLAPATPHAPRLHRLVLVGAQSAYWRDFPHPQRWPMALLWHGLLPALTGLVGYFPARALRLGEDLPRGVAMQWAMRPWRDPWHDETFAAGYARALPPVHLIAAADDPFATPAALARVAVHFRAAAPQMHTIAAGGSAARRIGHFNLFRSPCAQQVWPRLLQLALPAEPGATGNA
jgi:predicted alpha/beta hydrolase